MDPATRLVNHYLKYDKGWFSHSDVSVGSGQDVGLLAVDPATVQRYQVEVELGRGPLDETTPARASEWLQKRFGGTERDQALMQFGYSPRSSTRILVTRHMSKSFAETAAKLGVEIWIFSDIAEALRKALRSRVAGADAEGRLLQMLIYPPKSASPPE